MKYHLTRLFLLGAVCAVAPVRAQTNIASELAQVAVSLEVGYYDETNAFVALSQLELDALPPSSDVVLRVRGPATGMVYLLTDAFIPTSSPIYDDIVSPEGLGLDYLDKAPETFVEGFGTLVAVPMSLFEAAVVQPLAPPMVNPQSFSQRVLSYFQPLLEDLTTSEEYDGTIDWSVDNTSWNTWGPYMKAWWSSLATKPQDPNPATPGDLYEINIEALWQMAAVMESGPGVPFPKLTNPVNETYYQHAMEHGLGLTIQAYVVTASATTDLTMDAYAVNSPGSGYPGLEGLLSGADLAGLEGALSSSVTITIQPLAQYVDPTLVFAHPATPLTAAMGTTTVDINEATALPFRLCPHLNSFAWIRRVSNPADRYVLPIEYAGPGLGSIVFPAIGQWELYKLANPWQTVEYAGGVAPLFHALDPNALP